MTVPPRSGSRTGVVIASVIALALVAVVGIFVVQRLVQDDDTVSSEPATSSAPTGGATPGAGEGSTQPAPPSSGGPATESAPARATPSAARPGWVAQRTPDGWSYEVPDGAGWTSSHDVMAYVDRGKVLVRATQPTYLGAGACKNPRSVARGVVGWATPEAGKTSAEVAMNWATAVAVRDDGSQDPISRVITRPVSNAAMEVEKSVVTVRMTTREGCLPRAVKVSAISYRGEGGSRTLVIVRDLGVDGGMSGTVEEQIVRGVRHTPS